MEYWNSGFTEFNKFTCVNSFNARYLLTRINSLTH